MKFSWIQNLLTQNYPTDKKTLTIIDERVHGPQFRLILLDGDSRRHDGWYVVVFRRPLRPVALVEARVLQLPHWLCVRP